MSMGTVRITSKKHPSDIFLKERGTENFLLKIYPIGNTKQPNTPLADFIQAALLGGGDCLRYNNLSGLCEELVKKVENFDDFSDVIMQISEHIKGD